MNRRNDMKSGRILFWLLPLLLMLVAVFLVVRFGLWGTQEGAPAEGQQLGADNTAGQNTVGLELSDPVLGKATKASDDYLRQTLFLGDANTERLYLCGLLELRNMMGKADILLEQVPVVAFIRFSGDEDYYTMPQAVAECGPQRVLTSFGTNDLPHLTVDEFIRQYRLVIGEIQQCYPYCDIIVNAVFPFARENSEGLSLEGLAEYNQALREMCRQDGLVFLNSVEALADSSGYAKEGYTEADGVHLSSEGLAAFMEYFMTHPHAAQDRRPQETAWPSRLP